MSSININLPGVAKMNIIITKEISRTIRLQNSYGLKSSSSSRCAEKREGRLINFTYFPTVGLRFMNETGCDGISCNTFMIFRPSFT